MRLTLLGRPYCHLCGDMEAALAPLLDECGPRRPELAVINVDDFPELEARYGDLVPVLLDGDRELCHYHLDAQRVREHLLQLRAPLRHE